MKNSLKIVSLKFGAFRSFADAQDTGVLPDNGLFGIIGKNNSTTGSSGSGKTNFHLALSYALGYCPFPATELQSWLTKEPMQVELTMETPSGLVIVKRGAETSISIDGVKFEGARVVDTKLKEILVWPISLIEALTFRQQKMPGRFLSMTDGEKKEFLCSLLGLQDIENQIESASKKSNEIEKEFTELSIIISTLRNQLKAPVGDLSEKEERRLNIANKHTTSLSERLLIKNEIDRNIKSIKEVSLPEYDTKVLELSAALKIQLSNDEKLKLLIKDQIKGIDIKLDGIERYEPTHFYHTKIDELEKAIAAYHKAICHTCEQPWQRDSSWIEDAEITMTGLNTEFLNSISYHSFISKLQAEKRVLRDTLINFKNEKTVELQQQLKSAETEKDINYKVKCAALWEEQEKLQEQYKKATETSTSLLAMLERTQYEISDFKDTTFKHLKLVTEINKKQDTCELIRSKMAEESDFALMLKGFLGAIFTEVLQEIANEANDTLKQLPNVAATTIQFDTEVTSQKGKLRQEIKPVIVKNGITIPVRSGLSGGQFTSVELATDLAIGKIIAQRTGLSLNWLVLDESFEGHDVPVKEACLELLKNAAKDKLIFVIDHATEVNEYFDKCITIESNNDCSYIKDIA